MAQRGLPYEYEIEEGKSGLTAMGGLPTYLDLASATGLLKSIDRHLKVCGDQGWTDRQMVMSVVLLNLAGGNSVDDINKLEGDEGFCRILRKVEEQGLTRKERLEQKRVLQEALEQLPAYITKVRLRSDTAGYQHDLLGYCDKEDNKRFGKIEFAIGCDVTQEFRRAVSEVSEKDWSPQFRKDKDELVMTGRQWAEVCYWCGYREIILQAGC